MFSGILAAFNATPLGRAISGNAVKFIAILIGLLLITALAFGAYKYVEGLKKDITDRDASIATLNTTVGTQKQQLADAKSAIATLNQQLADAKRSQDVTNAEEVALKNALNDAQAQSQVRVTKHDAYVTKIETDPTIAPNLKHELISKADVDLLWQGYCAMPNVSNATCQQYTTDPVTNPLPMPVMPLPALKTPSPTPPAPVVSDVAAPASALYLPASDPPPTTAPSPSMVTQEEVPDPGYT